MTNTEIKKWADLKKSLLAKENKDLIETAIAMGSIKSRIKITSL